MIPEILDEIPEDAVMYLINALAFEAEWNEIYNKRQISKGKFTKEDKTLQNAEFMYNEENTYIEDHKATGFIKYYKDRKYAFAAILPKEGVSVPEYIDSLDGRSLNSMLSNPQRAAVLTSIPKFESEYSIEMSEILKKMGMPRAFDRVNAELQGLGTYESSNLYINRVLHKTFISVGEKGTKAGAATVVEIDNESAMQPPDYKEVYLDRPFVYMLIDCSNNIPFFIGTMTDVTG